MEDAEEKRLQFFMGSSNKLASNPAKLTLKVIQTQFQVTPRKFSKSIHNFRDALSFNTKTSLRP